MEKWLQKKHQQFDGSATDKDKDEENENKSDSVTHLTCSDESDSEVNSSKQRTKKIKRKRLATKSKKDYPKFSENWLNVPEFKDWLKKSSIKSNTAYCKICLADIVCYNKNRLVRHSKSSKHISNMKTIENTASQQKIDDLMQDLPLNKQIKRAELILAATIAVKCISFSFMDTLTPILSKIFSDSKIAKQMSLKRTKATAIIHSLSTVLLEDLAEKLMKPGSFFSLIMDETTDLNNIKQCALSIIYYDDETGTIRTNFFDIVETDSATAEDLYSLLIKVVTDKNIPLKNLVGFSSDTANNMAGDNLPVFALLKTKLPDIVNIKCSCHIIHLVASKACLKLSSSAEELLRNLAAYFHRSYKRIKGLEEFQEYFEVKITTYNYVKLQQLDNEWKEHTLLNLEDYNIDVNSTAEIYWQQIFKLTNPVGEIKFKNLKIVINFLLVLPFSNVSVERIFSDLKNIKTDHRNCLSSKTLKSLIATKNLLSKNDSILDFEPSEKMMNANIWNIN